MGMCFSLTELDSNAMFKEGNIFLFGGEDPQVTFEIQEEWGKIKKLTIDCEYLKKGSEVYEEILNSYETKINNDRTKMNNYEIKMNDYETKMSEYETKNNEYAIKMNECEIKITAQDAEMKSKDEELIQL